MTRDRPASGGTDSTLEGEFPSELGGGRAAPLEANVLSDPYLPNFLNNTAGDYEGNVAYPSGLNLLAINNQAVGGGLSGVYRFDTNSQIFTQNVIRTASASGTMTGSATAVSLGQMTVTQGMVGGFTAGIAITPTTGTLSTLYIGAVGLNITPDHFDTYYSRTLGAYAYDAAGAVFNSPGAISLTANSGLVSTFRAPPVPAYEYRYQTTGITQGNPTKQSRFDTLPFIPNSSTTITAYGIIYGKAPTPNVSYTFFATLAPVSEPTPDGTLKSSL